ncbi:hypothetical protein AURDEDRAFT_111520 [Auricularia subglabra TFB-10046 SS5]|nr:hypothetical protein AURDEDRAFT_111520 [Auricularia subglabra TFB-10046 SS5]
MSTPSPSPTDDEHDSYHPPGSPSASAGAPASAHATTSKRGRKPAPGSRAAREALRKSNHSIIEKRRREKINETMTALRTLLADGYKPPAKPAQEAEEAGQEGGVKGKPKAQDFKLEVLTRSVEYIHQLLDRISALETQLSQQQQQQQPAPSSRNSKRSEAAPGKRKRTAEDDEAPAPPPPPPSTRLPSISSLLNPQLPSPPMSVPMRPTAQDIPPILTLPAPNKADGAPWTPDEEHVASLLLNISSPTDPKRPKRVSMTPGGILGIRPASL